MSILQLKSRFFSTGLLTLLVLGVKLSQAEAGLGIIVTQSTVMPVGDPLAQYDFKLSLVAGNQIINGDNITLLNVPDYSGTSSYAFMSGGIDYSKFFTIVASAGSSAGLTNLELVLTASPGSLINTDQVNNLAIGDLIVGTTVEYPPMSNSPLYTPLIYTTQTHLFPLGTLNLGVGITPMPAIVPEPSSLAMLGVGFTSAWVLSRGRRRRDQTG